ncbi:MAG: ComF family protein [Candidatus Cryptobacteroides sp.]
MSVAEPLASIADLLLPRQCVVCGRELGRKEKHICIDCLVGMPLTYHWTRMENPMADKFNALIAKENDGPEYYALATALFDFEKGTGYRHVTHSLKYRHDIPAGRFFSRMLASRLKETFAHVRNLPSPDAVVPVPLHWTRRLTRGYNQAEIIASEISRELDVPVLPDLLRRTRRTHSQTSLEVPEKMSNVSGAFEVNPKANLESLRHVLLVDDVFTTGATLSNCFRPLRKAAGPALRISIATLGAV